MKLRVGAEAIGLVWFGLGGGGGGFALVYFPRQTALVPKVVVGPSLLLSPRLQRRKNHFRSLYSHLYSLSRYVMLVVVIMLSMKLSLIVPSCIVVSINSLILPTTAMVSKTRLIVLIASLFSGREESLFEVKKVTEAGRKKRRRKR